MALVTLGTFAQTSLFAVQFNESSGVMSDADLAQINQLIRTGIIPRTNLGTYIERAGQLNVPGRGWLSVKPGDYLGVDAATGWPILLSAEAAAGAAWVHT